MSERFFRRFLAGRCALCDESTSADIDICQNCAADLPFCQAQCRWCAYPLPARSDPALSLCGQCLSRPPPVAATVAICDYAYPADTLVTGLKFRDQLENGRIMGRLMARHITRLADPVHQRVSVLLPVPLTRWRYWGRGFNQSNEIAIGCGAGLGLPVRGTRLWRTGHQQPQTGLSAPERRQNVQGVFRARNLCGHHVALVDDVMTTGSTVFDAARAVRQAGAESVVVWVFARARIRQARMVAPGVS